MLHTCTHAKIHLDSCTLIVTIRVKSKMCSFRVQCEKLAFHTLMCWQSISTRLNSNTIGNLLLGMTSTSTSLNSVSPNVFDSSIVMFHKGVWFLECDIRLWCFCPACDVQHIQCRVCVCLYFCACRWPCFPTQPKPFVQMHCYATFFIKKSVM